MGFILTKNEQDKDEQDRVIENIIREKIKARCEEKWYQEDKKEKQQYALMKSGISFAFGILEDIPQLTL